MNNEAYQVLHRPIGWVLELLTVSERGEVETGGCLIHVERDHPDEKWLMLFRTRGEAFAYIAANLPADALEDCRWACTELTELEVLKILTDNPVLAGVLFAPGSDEAHFVSAAVWIGALVKETWGEQEGDAA